MELCISKRAIFFGVLCLLTSSARAEDALDHWYFRDSLQLSRVRFVGGMFIGLGGNGTLATSVDGKTWVTRSTGTSAGLNGVAFGGMFPARQFIAVGGTGTILRSTDGTNWSRIITTNTCDLKDVAWNGGAFAALTTFVETNQPNILYSTDGTNWSNATFPLGVWPFPQITVGDAIIAAEGAFIASAGPGFSHDLWRSTSGFSWDYVGHSDQQVGGIAYGNNRLLLVGWEGRPMTSTNLGVNWTTLFDTNVCNPGPSSYCMVGSDVAFGNGTFVIARSFLRDGLLTTTDCQTWNKRSVFKGMSKDSVAFGQGTFVAVGADGIYQSEPVATPVLSTIYAPDSNALQIAISGEIGRAYRLQTSSLASAWSDRWAFTNISGTTTFVETMNTNTASLFYRVISP